jgi:hypothetical protein
MATGAVNLLPETIDALETWLSMPWYQKAYEDRKRVNVFVRLLAKEPEVPDQRDLLDLMVQIAVRYQFPRDNALRLLPEFSSLASRLKRISE